MPVNNGATLLSVWERGATEFLGERALTLLALAAPAIDQPDSLTAGERDAALLRIRRDLFGDAIEAVTLCTFCSEQLEVTLSASDLLRDLPAARREAFPVETDGRFTMFRAPTAGDLAFLAGTNDVERGVAMLLERCAEPETVTPDMADVFDDALADADPFGEIKLVMVCPACDGKNAVAVDLPSFLFKEVAAAAIGVLANVHELALAYGWTEEAILNLSSERRRFYLGAVRA